MATTNVRNLGHEPLVFPSGAVLAVGMTDSFPTSVLADPKVKGWHRAGLVGFAGGVLPDGWSTQSRLLSLMDGAIEPEPEPIHLVDGMSNGLAHALMKSGPTSAPIADAAMDARERAYDAWVSSINEGAR